MMSVSIALGAYNGEQYIEQQLDSIIPQLEAEDEIIISVNPSNDKTLDIAREYEGQNEQIHVFVCEQKGVVPNFTNAVCHCKNDIICFSDQDDIWMPEKIAEIKKAFSDIQVTVVIHDVVICDENMHILRESKFGSKKVLTSVIGQLYRLRYVGCAMAFRRKMLKVMLPFPTKERSIDWWSGMICSMYGDMAVICKPLLMQRRHAGTVSPSKTPKLKEQVKIRWILLSNTFKRGVLMRAKYRKLLLNDDRIGN